MPRNDSTSAGTICKILGFRGGSPTGQYTGNLTHPVFLDDVRCTGSETSILQCGHSGWKTNNGYQCNNGTYKILCFRGVRLEPGPMAGVIQVERYGNNENWYPMCSEVSSEAATVVCRQLDASYSYYRILPTYLFTSNELYVTAMSYVSCIGTEETIMDCSHRNYRCYRRASIVCSESPINTELRVNTVAEGFSSSVSINMYNVNGSICATGWNDNAARVLCRQSGYRFSASFGSVLVYTSSPRLASNFMCTGQETNLNQCTYGTSNLRDCQESNNYANTFCSNNPLGFQIRLKPGNHSAQRGLVQLRLQGIWGNICVTSLYRESLSRSICQQSGYLTGFYDGSFTPDDSEPTWLYGLQTCSDTSHFWKCPMEAFNTTQSCSGYLSVQCKASVELQPGPYYGAVQFTVNDTTGLVCDDGFTATAASVTCRQLGFIYSSIVKYSPYQSTNRSVIFNNFKCTDYENRLDECVYDRRYCVSRRPVYILCSNLPSTSGYDVNLDFKNYGRVTINHRLVDGTVCPDDWTDKDARVVCREATVGGHIGAMAYKRINHGAEVVNPGIKWLSRLNCTGTETYLSQCPGFNLGSVSNCSMEYSAGAYCYKNSGLKVRLAGGLETSGRVEVSLDGKWGSVCSLTDSAAIVICKMLNYTGGHVTTPGRYGSNNSSVVITSIDCNGTEDNLLDCGLLLASNSNSCSSDPGVRCYSDVRLTNTNYGRLELEREEGVWRPVCNTNFTEEIAREACRLLGFMDGTYRTAPGVDNSTGITINNCSYSSPSRSLGDICSFTSGCHSNSYAIIYCSDQQIDESEFNVTITTDVLLLSTVPGLRGAVCSQGWGDTEAHVVCKQTGYTGGVASYATNTGNYSIMYGNFNCSGNETNLNQCQAVDTTFSCSETDPTEVAGALCYRSKDEIGVTLSEGFKGSVSINMGFKRYKVCYYTFWTNERNVICRQLGYMAGGYGEWSFTRYDGNYLDVDCAGTESSIYQCKRKTSRYCVFSASVTCFNKLRTNWGSLQVDVGGSWGQVCGDDWTTENTAVACKELFYQNGYAILNTRMYSTPAASMTRVSCHGNETSILDCSYSLPQTQYCHQKFNLDCFNGNLTNEFSWSIDGGNAYTGYIKVHLSGATSSTGTICSDGWDDADADVACREKGFTSGAAFSHTTTTDLANYPYWMTKIRCNGTEERLTDCDYHIGDVTFCSSNKVAGILCTNQQGIFYSLSGDNGQGLVQVSIDGQWGTLCTGDNIRSDQFYDVFCRSVGYTTGHSVDELSSPPVMSGPIYTTVFSCAGYEESLHDCPHSSWTHNASCLSYETVQCVQDVKLIQINNRATRDRGPVQVYYKNTWQLVCDDGFDDASAKRVCQDLSYEDGVAVCCSGFGYSNTTVVSGLQLSCNGSEEKSLECLEERDRCTSGLYASVVCFQQVFYGESTYNFTLQNTTSQSMVGGSGAVDALQFGVQGGICGDSWNNRNAEVFCRSQGYQHGLSYLTHPAEDDAWPYWLSDVTCSGSEVTLSECRYKTRLDMNNCTTQKRAAVRCYNGELDVSYEFVNSTNRNTGVMGWVRLKVGDDFADICYNDWGPNEADVFCRQIGYDGGQSYSYGNTRYQGNWIRRLECAGTETNLLQCAHGDVMMNNESCTSNIEPGAFCYNSVRIVTSYDAGEGQVNIYNSTQKAWLAVCDAEFTDEEATSVCNQLGFTYGQGIVGSAYGETNVKIGIERLDCSGNNVTFSECEQIAGDTCSTMTYASVQCSNTRQPLGFSLTLYNDLQQYAGMLTIGFNGLTGSVCADGFGKPEAMVSCRQLGYHGGAPYYSPNRLNTLHNPIIMADVTCQGNETSLDECDFKSDRNINLTTCRLQSKRAGVLCYNGSGIEYRLRRQTAAGVGKFEMRYDDVWGKVCVQWYPGNKAAGVMCRSVGYLDGILLSRLAASQSLDSLPETSSVDFLENIMCTGVESTIAECHHSSFLRYGYPGCRSTIMLHCFNQPLEITGLRLAGHDSPRLGRVEVYMQGPNQWGTVCNLYFDDREARVICHQLGYTDGAAIKKGWVNRGQGPIWLSTLECNGNERNIKQCLRAEYSHSDCSHDNDAGVVCSGGMPLMTSVTPTTSTSPTTTPGSPTTGSPATTPGSPATTPGSPATTPGSTATTPGSPATTPGSTATTPRSPATTPGSPTTTPGSPTTTPGSTATTPGSPTVSSTEQQSTAKSTATVTLTRETTPSDGIGQPDKHSGLTQEQVTYTVGGVCGGIIVILVIIVGIKLRKTKNGSKGILDDQKIYDNPTFSPDM